MDWTRARDAHAGDRPADAEGGATFRLARLLAAQDGHWLGWAAVAFAAGVAAYFALPVEPPPAIAAAAAGAAAVAVGLRLAGRLAVGGLLAAAVAAGFAVAVYRVGEVAAPALAASTGEVRLAGRIATVEPSARGWYRLAIEVARIDGVREAAWPRRVQLSVPRKHLGATAAGAAVIVPARLWPLAAPDYPGGYDHARTLWFRGIGALGRASGEVVADPTRAGAPPGLLDAWRQAINARIERTLPRGTAGLAMALITGERGLIDPAVNRAMQDSGLAHILSISGLHMSLVAGGLFWAVRALLAAVPAAALHWPIKKIAAVLALAAGAVYLAISGNDIATQRSFIMIAIMFAAVLLDRAAISMRNLAVAALVVMVLTPEAALTASFQMSFLAVMGLIGAYEAVAEWRARRQPRPAPASPWGRVVRAGLAALAGMALTTLVAGVFSGLPAAYHFNRVAVWSLAANLLALPVVSAVVMPAAVAAVLAMPLGLEAVPLQAMAAGIGLVELVARWVAGWPSATFMTPDSPALAALLAALGLCALMLWRSALRWSGVVLIAAGALAAAWPHERPDILIERTAAAVAARMADGRLAAVVGRPSSYAIGQWLRADGDDATPRTAAARPGWQCEGEACRATVKGRAVVYAKADAALPAACAGADIVIAAVPLRGRCREVALRIDRFDVWRSGAHALHLPDAPDGAVRIETVRATRGQRPWVIPPVARRDILEETEETPAAAEQ